MKNLSFPLVEGKALKAEHAQKIPFKRIEMLLGEPSDDSTDLFSQNLAGFIGGSSDVLQIFHVSFCQMSPISSFHQIYVR